MVKNGKMKFSGESIFIEDTRKNLKVKSRTRGHPRLESNDHFGSIAGLINSAKTIREHTSAVLENQIKYGACASGFGSGIEVLPIFFLSVTGWHSKSFTRVRSLFILRPCLSLSKAYIFVIFL